jgi:hypothetical protein
MLIIINYNLKYNGNSTSNDIKLKRNGVNNNKNYPATPQAIAII